MTSRNANPDLLINWFDTFVGHNDYAFLSNFYKGEPIDMKDGMGPIYKTGEHAFQAYKAIHESDFNRVVAASSPGRAKEYGRRLALRSDWESVKYDVMRCVLRAKFAQGRPEASMLVDTGTAMLVEGTDWNDTVWGVDNETDYGRNWLGTLLMARRAELRSGVNNVETWMAALNFATPDLGKA